MRWLYSLRGIIVVAEEGKVFRRLERCSGDIFEERGTTTFAALKRQRVSLLSRTWIRG